MQKRARGSVYAVTRRGVSPLPGQRSSLAWPCGLAPGDLQSLAWMGGGGGGLELTPRAPAGALEANAGESHREKDVRVFPTTVPAEPRWSPGESPGCGDRRHRACGGSSLAQGAPPPGASIACLENMWNPREDVRSSVPLGRWLALS